MNISINNSIVTIDDEVVGRITGTTCETIRKLSSPVRGKINTIHGTKLNYILEDHVKVDHAGFANTSGPIGNDGPIGTEGINGDDPTTEVVSRKFDRLDIGPRPERNPRLGNHCPKLQAWLKKGGK